MEIEPFDVCCRNRITDIVSILEVPSKDGQVVPTIVHAHIVPPVACEANHGTQLFDGAVCPCRCHPNRSSRCIWAVNNCCLLKRGICLAVMIIITQNVKPILSVAMVERIPTQTILLVARSSVLHRAGHEVVRSIMPSILHHVILAKCHRFSEVVLRAGRYRSHRTGVIIIFRGTESVEEATSHVPRIRCNNFRWICTRCMRCRPPTSLDEGRLDVAEVQDGSGSIRSATMGKFHVSRSRMLQVVSHAVRVTVNR